MLPFLHQKTTTTIKSEPQKISDHAILTSSNKDSLPSRKINVLPSSSDGTRGKKKFIRTNTSRSQTPSTSNSSLPPPPHGSKSIKAFLKPIPLEESEESENSSPSTSLVSNISIDLIPSSIALNPLQPSPNSSTPSSDQQDENTIKSTHSKLYPTQIKKVVEPRKRMAQRSRRLIKEEDDAYIDDPSPLGDASSLTTVTSSPCIDTPAFSADISLQNIDPRLSDSDICQDFNVVDSLLDKEEEQDNSMTHFDESVHLIKSTASPLDLEEKSSPLSNIISSKLIGDASNSSSLQFHPTSGKSDGEQHITVMNNSSYSTYINRAGPLHHGEKDIPVGSPTCLDGYIFIITGVLDSLDREDATKLIESCGGRCCKTLGRKVTHALVGLDAGPSKMAVIKSRKLPILDEDGLFTLIVEKSGNKAIIPSRLISSVSPVQSDTKSSALPSIAKLEVDNETLQQKFTKSTQHVSNPSPSKTATTNARSTSKMIWTDKYQPQHLSQVVGNLGNVNKLSSWLNNWAAIFHQATLSTSSNKGKFVSTCLLTGPPGIGKTSSALLVTKLCGFKAIHLNASDQRSKSTLKEHVQSLLSSHSIGEFFHTEHDSNGLRKAVLIMDEIDGMSTSDRGGLQELNMMTRMTKVPIIAIANDRYKVKTLASSSFVLHLPYYRPTTNQIFTRMATILKKEHLEALNATILSRIIESSSGDLRMILNFLQMLSNNPGSLIHSNNPSDDLKMQLENSSKDLTLTVFDVIPRIFNTMAHSSNQSLNDPLELYFVDYSLVPLFIQQNYLKTQDNTFTTSMASRNNKSSSITSLKKDVANIQKYANAADAISLGDIISTTIHRQQQWLLLPVHGVISTLLPASYVKANVHKNEYPAIFSKDARTKKQREMLRELTSDLFIATHRATSQDVLLDYLPLLIERTLNPLLQGSSGIQEIIDFMNVYSISQAGHDTILELAKLEFTKNQIDSIVTNNIYDKIPASVKSAFTRACNASSNIKSSKVRPSNKRKATTSYEDGDDEEEDDGQKTEQDALVYIKSNAVGSKSSRSKKSTTTATKKKRGIVKKDINVKAE